MIKIFSGFCPSMSNHLLLKMQIIKVLKPQPPSKEELHSWCFCKTFTWSFWEMFCKKNLEEQDCSLSFLYLGKITLPPHSIFCANALSSFWKYQFAFFELHLQSYFIQQTWKRFSQRDLKLVFAIKMTLQHVPAQKYKQSTTSRQRKQLMLTNMFAYMLQKQEVPVVKCFR